MPTLDKLKDARQALDFLHECFENSQIIRERATRDEQTAFTAYDLLFSQILIIEQAIKTEQSATQTLHALENVKLKEFSAKVHYYLSKFTSTKEGAYRQNIETYRNI